MHLAKTKVGMMDLIYCQNVLIYFKRQDRYGILDNMVKHLRPGGLLVLGAAEINDWKHEEMQAVSYQGTLAFRRTRAAGDGQS
jgi:chemotaxis methyl-accepting protein methylase